MPSAERGACAAQHDYRCLAGFANCLQAAREFLHVFQGEGVALFGAVHGNEGYGLIALVSDVLVGAAPGLDH